jgi:ketosteroid isomerase-like protein
MRSNIIYLLAILFIGAIACIKYEEKVETAAEEEAIKAIIKKQLVAVGNFDYEGEAEVWAHEPYIVAHGVVGWDSLSIWYKTNFREFSEKVKEDPENYVPYQASASNFDIHLNGNVAFVFYDHQSSYTYDGEKHSGVSRRLKCLEKKEGKWKMVAFLPSP